MSRSAASMIKSLVVALAIACSLPANAVVVNGGFSGEIFSCCGDPTGFFGTGGDLDGLPITGTFTYDTAKVPPPQTSGPETIYSDPTFSTDFLRFTVTINGRTYTSGQVPLSPGIQSISVINNTDQLQIDSERLGVNASETLSLRFISDVDFLSSTQIPTQFDFVASGVGLNPVGFFAFELPNGDAADARFSIATGFARELQVPEPATLSIVSLPLIGLAALRSRRTRALSAQRPTLAGTP